MKERPILFSAPMVRAILDGRKTQTRRVVKPQPVGESSFDGYAWHGSAVQGEQLPPLCRYGQPGDRLWVRETWGIALCGSRVSLKLEAWPEGLPVDRLRYAADGVELGVAVKRPSIHMPRWASRITLEVTGVRVERLQAISEGDAKAEGASPHLIPDIAVSKRSPMANQLAVYSGARDIFSALWESINGAGSWEANPWVWVVEFRRLP